MRPARHLMAFSAALLLAWPMAGAQRFHGRGTMTVDGETTALAFEASAVTPKPYESPDLETLVLIADRTLDDTAPDDALGLSRLAKAGKVAALTIRMDGARVVNVAFTHQKLGGTIVLPGAWFGFRHAKTARGAVAGSLTLPGRTWDGHTYACAVDFAAAAAPPSPPRPTPAPAAPRPPQTGAPARVPEAETLVKTLLQAMLQKDEERAIRLIQVGADPNGMDKTGRRMLTWAVILCLPNVVQALVDAKADVTRVRPPGITVLQDASECPEVVDILRAAGAK